MTFNLKTFPNQDYILSPQKAINQTIIDKGGKKYLDLTAGGTSFALIGYGNKKVEDAIIEQLRKFPHLDCKSFDDSNREELSKILINSSDAYKGSNRKVFFSGGSGAEAIEMAMHMSYQWHYEKGFKNKKWFLSRNQSYHGATSGALSIGERPNLEFFRPLQANKRVRVSECNYQKNKHKNETELDYTDRLVNELKKTIEEIGGENICAFIGETIMGGLVGDVPPTKYYWEKVHKLCKEYDIHLILDEIWCGTGSSGKYHCFEYDNVMPEFLILGKSLGCGYIPISAVIVDGEFEETIKNGSKRIETSCTFQGHSVAVASSLAVQKIITSDTFIYDVYKKGNYIRDSLKSLLGDHEFIKDIRGRGVRNSIEYQTGNNQLFSKLLTERMFNEKNIIISSKWHRTSFSHAMTINMQEIDYYLESFYDSFIKVADSNEWLKNKNTKLKKFRQFF